LVFDVAEVYVIHNDDDHMTRFTPRSEVENIHSPIYRKC
jgi:hypothetical protein